MCMCVPGHTHGFNGFLDVVSDSNNVAIIYHLTTTSTITDAKYA